MDRMNRPGVEGSRFQIFPLLDPILFILSSSGRSCPSYDSKAVLSVFSVISVVRSGNPASVPRYFWAMYFRKFRARIVIRTVPAISTTERALITGETPKRIMEYT